MPPANLAHNCPFYGRVVLLTLLGSDAIPRQRLRLPPGQPHQCALKLRSMDPCDRYMREKPIDWRECPVYAHTVELLKGRV